MEQNIWQPLGMTSTTFNVEKDPRIKERQVDMSLRTESGTLEHLSTPVFASPAEDDCGGVGIYTTAPDYIKILEDLVSSDSKLLKAGTIDEMFKPQLPDPVHLETVLKVPALKQVLGGNLPAGLKVNHGLGGLVTLEPLPTGRPAGSMQWGGMPNLYWVRISRFSTERLA